MQDCILSLLCHANQLAGSQVASPAEIPAEAKATTVFLLHTTTTTRMIQDSIPKLKIDFLNNHCSDLDKIWKNLSG